MSLITAVLDSKEKKTRQTQIRRHMIYYVIKYLIYFAFDPFMTHFRMKVVPRRKPEKPSPPVLSNDWIIQNHGDIGKGLFHDHF